MTTSAAAFPHEVDLIPPVTDFLEQRGYRVLADPDRTGYFDIVALRGEEIGLVELKLHATGAVFQQAVRRRLWGDWVAVALPGERAARALVGRTRGERSSRVGVYVVRPQGVDVLREASPMFDPSEPGPTPERRELLRQVLQQRESGEIPAETSWAFAVHPPRPPPGRRAPRGGSWTLEEYSRRERSP
ncbi:MAG: hypothetical protein L3K03_06000 [Thermoplasmata archaeon]|nr:hypothetical protein [Thermoplasmata archaeon]